ncbi:MAG TPA: hypothetical protein VK048_04730 [Atopostipes sp.]|nr:hypothetical protein [Atopostipes sp.]
MIKNRGIKKDGSSANKPSEKIKGLTIHLSIYDIQLKQVKSELPKN